MNFPLVMARNASPQEKHKSPHSWNVFSHVFFPLKPIKITGVFRALIPPAMEATPWWPLRSGRGSIGQISLAALRKDDGDSLYDTLVDWLWRIRDTLV